MQQNEMFLFNRTKNKQKKASILCYCCPGVMQATKMLRKLSLHEMYRCINKTKAENSVSTNNYILMIIIIMLSPIKMRI